jgi:hypothetical protein
MKRFLVGFILSALCLISFSATASPYSNERLKTEIHDVGWQVVIVAEDFTANVAVFVLNSNNTTNHPIDAVPVDVGKLLLNNSYAYSKKKFVSFNKSANRRKTQLYGRTESEYRTIATEADIPPLPDTYNLIKKEINHPVTEYPAVE